MLTRWFFVALLLLVSPARAAAQEPYVVAYAGFAGFQAPVWAPKDLGLMAKYGFNGDVVLVPGSVRQIQALQGGSIHFAQVDAATAINAIMVGFMTVVNRVRSILFLIASWRKESANQRFSRKKIVFWPWASH
jgi:hypothetical protein